MKIWQRIFLLSMAVTILSINLVGFWIIRSQHQNNLENAIAETYDALNLHSRAIEKQINQKDVTFYDDQIILDTIAELYGKVIFPKYHHRRTAIYEDGNHKYSLKVLDVQFTKELDDEKIQQSEPDEQEMLRMLKENEVPTNPQQFLFVRMKVKNLSKDAINILFNKTLYNITSDEIAVHVYAKPFYITPVGFNTDFESYGYTLTFDSNEEKEVEIGYLIPEKEVMAPLYMDLTSYSQPRESSILLYLGELKSRIIEPEITPEQALTSMTQEITTIPSDTNLINNLGVCITFAGQTFANRIFREDYEPQGFYQENYQKLHFNSYASFDLYGNTLTIYLQNDLSDILDDYRKQIRNLQLYSILISVLIGTFFMIIIYFLLKPLKTIHEGVSSIAKGAYHTRLKVKGNTELSDLTEDINDMAQSLESYIRQIEQTSENQKVFIDNMAHEMKTPLTSILGFADILSIKSTLAEEERREYSEIIVKEATRLRNLSGKLMEIVQIQNHMIEFQPLNLKELLEECITIQSIILKEKKLMLQISLQTSFILGDHDLLQSLIFNILDNSRKASLPGQSIKITLSEEDNWSIITIRDYGRGMNQDEIEKVTQPFYMADKSRSRKAGGAGLGLTLCTEIVKLHHGSMTIESEPQKGCKTILKFPKGGIL